MKCEEFASANANRVLEEMVKVGEHSYMLLWQKLKDMRFDGITVAQCREAMQGYRDFLTKAEAKAKEVHNIPLPYNNDGKTDRIKEGQLYGLFQCFLKWAACHHFPVERTEEGEFVDSNTMSAWFGWYGHEADRFASWEQYQLDKMRGPF